MKQLESIDSGNNYSFGDKLIPSNAPRSSFDLSYRKIGGMCENGVIMPLALIPTLPTDEFDISIDTLLRAMPTVVPLESRQRMYIYAFYSRLGDLWNKFEVFARKGNDGKYIGQIPTLTEGKNIITSLLETENEKTMNTTWETNDSIQSTSMGESMDLPHNYTEETHGSGESKITAFANKTNIKKFIKNPTVEYAEPISALPFMMLLRIWRDYFLNKNYVMSDKVIFPDDDTEFRLNNDGELISAKDNNKKVCFDISSKQRGIRYMKDETENDTLIVGLPVHEYPKDRFTSALPFLMRGDEPYQEIGTNTVTIDGKPIQWGKFTHNEGAIPSYMLFRENNETSYNQIITSNSIYQKNGGEDTLVPIGKQYTAPVGNQKQAIYIPTEYGQIPNYKNFTETGEVKGENTLRITMNLMRALAIEQTELERMAKTDGSYAEFGLTFFGIVPKNAEDHKPVYIGGTYKEILYTEVVQTSEGENTPLGSYTGHSTSTVNDNIGHIRCDDYGYIMILGCIMPDVIYSEGLEAHWTNLYQSDFYLPERTKIGLTNLLNKTLRYDYGTTTDSVEKNNNLFAYQQYADEYRYRENRIAGALAEGWNQSYFPYTQSRIIGREVQWGREFGTATDIRNDYLYAPKEIPFTYDMGIHIHGVRPIPYKNTSANLTGLVS